MNLSVRENPVIRKAGLKPVRRTLQSVFALALVGSVVPVTFCERSWGHGWSIRHDSLLKLTAANIDVEIELTFQAMQAQRERWQMDTDRNGIITRTEMVSYIAKKSTVFKKAIALRAKNRELAIVPLYNPELDLLGNNRTGAHPFTLRLFYFSRTPKWLTQYHLIELEDRLWLDEPAVCSMDALGEADLRATPRSAGYSLRGPRISQLSRSLLTTKTKEQK